MPYFVYALTNPVTDEVRYVGMTNDAHARYKQHCYTYRSDQTDLANWIRELKASKLMPGLKILQIVDTENEVREREEYWIRYHLQHGSILTNKVLPPVLPEKKVEISKVINAPEQTCFREMGNLRLLLEHYRIQRAMSIRELAKVAGVSSATILRIEHDRYIPRPSVSTRLAAALGIQIADLIVDDDERPLLATA